MFFADIEGEAEVAYRSAGLGLDAPAPMTVLARRLLGRPVEVVHSRALPGDACLARVHGEPRIFVRRGLAPQRAKWAVAHELGHLLLRVDSSSPEHEDYCNALAACLVMPRMAFRCASGTPVWEDLARRFGTTESAVALRWGEVHDEPLALVAPSRVRVRGPEWAWPPEDQLRSGRLRGMARCRLGDDRRRVVLRAA